MNVDEMNEAFRGSVRNILENALMRSALGENAIDAAGDYSVSCECGSMRGRTCRCA